MARPATNHANKKAEIIQAAFKSFALHGYEGTSNKTIAQAGGFKSPALIYHYFPGGKAELFEACIRNFEPIRELTGKLEVEPTDPPEVFLKQLALTYLKLIKQPDALRLMQIVLSESGRFPELTNWLPDMLGPAIILPLVKYLGTYMAAGKLADRPPMALLMEFIGPMIFRMLIANLGLENRLPLPLPGDEELAETVVQTFLYGNWRGD